MKRLESKVERLEKSTQKSKDQLKVRFQRTIQDFLSKLDTLTLSAVADLATKQERREDLSQDDEELLAEFNELFEKFKSGPDDSSVRIQLRWPESLAEPKPVEQDAFTQFTEQRQLEDAIRSYYQRPRFAFTKSFSIWRSSHKSSSLMEFRQHTLLQKGCKMALNEGSESLMTSRSPIEENPRIRRIKQPDGTTLLEIDFTGLSPEVPSIDLHTDSLDDFRRLPTTDDVRRAMRL